MKYILSSLLLTGCFLSPTNQKKNSVHETSICDQSIYIDKMNNICWLRDGQNAASIGFQIPCSAAESCKYK